MKIMSLHNDLSLTFSQYGSFDYDECCMTAFLPVNKSSCS